MNVSISKFDFYFISQSIFFFCKKAFLIEVSDRKMLDFFCISGIHFFHNFNQVKKNQLLLNEVVNITDAKKKRINLLRLVGCKGKRAYFLLCDLIKHYIGIFFLVSGIFS